MNILYVNNSMHLGGDNKCILKLCKLFNSENKIFIASNGGPLENDIKDRGLKHYKINNVNDKSIKNLVIIIFQLRNIIKENNIQIIHSHHRMTTLLSKLARIGLSAKVIHTQHSCVEDKIKLNRLALNNIKIICVSNAVKDILSGKSKLKKENMTTIYNTISVDSSKEKCDELMVNSRNLGNFNVVQVGRLDSKKGIYDFVDIAKNVVTKNKRIKFFLIGDGEEKENLIEYVEKNKLSNSVKILGSKNNILEHLEFTDVLLLCSYLEGLPLTPIEAFYKKVPVIGTNIDGLNEEVIDGHNGFLVDPKDIKLFSEKIIELNGDRSLLTNMGSNAKKVYEELFEEKRYFEKHKKVYGDLLNV